MIEASGLTRRFGKLTAVDGVDLVVDRPGIVGLLGRNGAGKTTTLRMLTGALAATSGTARIAGFDVFDASLEVRRRVGYLPERPPLHPELTVGETLRFAAEVRGVPRARRLARVGEVMERVGLVGMERKLVGGLSKGYVQRVGLAQAIVHAPPVLVLDEPTTGLDPAQLPGLRALVRELARDRVVLLSTHVLQEVDALCERVVVLHEGRVVGDGTLAALGAQVGQAPWLEVALEGAEGAAAALAELDAVTEVEALPSAPGIARFRLRGRSDLAPAVALLASERGWGLRVLAPRTPRLEDVFLALVGGAR